MATPRYVQLNALAKSVRPSISAKTGCMSTHATMRLGGAALLAAVTLIKTLYVL